MKTRNLPIDLSFFLWVFIGYCSLWHCLFPPNMVHPQKWSCLCCCFPTSPNCPSSHHGVPHPRRSVILRRVKSTNSKTFVRRHYMETNLDFSLSWFKCRVIGAVLITLGLYLVLWGKSKEKALEEEDKCLKHPLLDDQKEEQENVVLDIAWRDCNVIISWDMNKKCIHNLTRKSCDFVKKKVADPTRWRICWGCLVRDKKARIFNL